MIGAKPSLTQLIEEFDNPIRERYLRDPDGQPIDVTGHGDSVKTFATAPTHPGFPCDLKPGDVLVYSGSSWWSRLIRIKTWSRATHVEMVSANGRKAYGAREDSGVGTWDLRIEGLVAVLRYDGLDMLDVVEFHLRCTRPRQGYDFLGLLRFFTWGAQSTDRQFCSEYVTRLLRAGGVRPFAPGLDADLVPPSYFEASPVPRVVWTRP